VAPEVSGTSISESLPGRDPVPAELPEYRARGITLVGQTDLGVLRVARDLRIGQTRVARGRRRDRGHFGYSLYPRRVEPGQHRLQQLGDPRLRRVGPLGERDQVDLAAVEPLGNHSSLEATRGQSLHSELRGPIERSILHIGREPAPDEYRSFRADLEQLGPSIEREQQASGTARTGPELAVDVAHVRAAHDDDVDTLRAQLLDELANAPSIGRAVGHRGSVPVEDDCFESAREQIFDQGVDRRFTTWVVDPGKKIVSWPSSQRTR